MKRYLILLFLALFVTSVASAAVYDDVYSDGNDSVELSIVKPAKPSKETKSERKAREKMMREHQDSISYMRACNAIKAGYFVVLADRLTMGRMGYTVSDINSNANFVLMQGDGGMVQVAFNGPNPGPNGIGGFTVSGRLSGKNVSVDKKGNVTVDFHVFSSQVNAEVFVTLYSGCNRAMATVMPTFNSGRITIYGNLVPYRDKSIRIEK